MENNKNIMKIYENTVDMFLKGFSNTELEAIRKMYISYLLRTYSRLELDDRTVRYYSNLEIIKWKDFNIEGKMSIISEDKNLDELVKLSMEGLHFADQFRRNGVLLDKKIANEKIELMDELLNKVLDFNKTLAAYYYSEGTLDFFYAAGLTDFMSLRTGRSK